jgi:branched-subunit amino acid transport protein
VNIWLVMLLGGVITFGMRFSLIYLLAEGRFHIPLALRRALHYVPPAVLSALIFPALFLPEDTWALAVTNHRLLAGLVAIGVAWFSKSALLTIVAGMLALFLFQWFL